MNWSGLDPSLVLPALLAGLLILFTHVPLGRIVLSRGIVFLDLAVAQIAGLGVIAAHQLGIESGIEVQVAAVMAALLGALLLGWTERHWPETQEALIGSTFVVAACVGILLLAHDPHGGEELQDLLAGQILWVGKEQLKWAGLVTAGLGLLLFSPFTRKGLGFYAIFAAAVTLSVQLAGVYLVFASLILPALAVRGVPGRKGLALAWTVGVLGYGLGLVASALMDWPSGAVIVCVIAMLSLMSGILRTRSSKAIRSA
ncbi:MAG: metal ABC transporter permease [Thiobacillaceae bacterium]